jgi:ATP-dependent RNA helicase MSS116, mitochondrial
VTLDTVGSKDPPTHLNIPQTYVQSPFSLQPVTLWTLIDAHRSTTPNAKIIVFFNTTKSVIHLSRAFNNLVGESTASQMDVLQIHSKLEQRQRSRVADRFRASREGVLFTSDVSARGVDYPNVTLVVQMGVPSSAEQYVHRIGRTGRAGRSGEGVLVVSAYELQFVKELMRVGVPIKVDVRHDAIKYGRDLARREVLKSSFARGDYKLAVDCYTAFIGFCK